jgi:hypothetical protein
MRSTISRLRRASDQDGSRAGHEGGGSPGRDSIPSRRRRRRSGAGAGAGVIRSFSGMRCSALAPAPALLRDESADATGYPLPAARVLRQTNALRAGRGDLGSCPSRARSHGDPREATGGDGQNFTDRASARFSASRSARAGSGVGSGRVAWALVSAAVHSIGVEQDVRSGRRSSSLPVVAGLGGWTEEDVEMSQLWVGRSIGLAAQRRPCPDG